MISQWKFSKLRRLHKLSYSITRCAKECHVDRKTAAKYVKDLDAPPEAAKAPRTYVTRKTDFDKFWPEIQAMLENENRLKPYSILEHMIEKHKEDFDPKWQKLSNDASPGGESPTALRRKFSSHKYTSLPMS